MLNFTAVLPLPNTSCHADARRDVVMPDHALLGEEDRLREQVGPIC
jgi:hypothetical protein